jgi:hypothetical protein
MLSEAESSRSEVSAQSKDPVFAAVTTGPARNFFHHAPGDPFLPAFHRSGDFDSSLSAIAASNPGWVAKAVDLADVTKRLGPHSCAFFAQGWVPRNWKNRGASEIYIIDIYYFSE